MLRVTGPLLRQRPAVLKRYVVKLRPRISHGGVKVCEFAVEFERQVESRLHAFEIVFWQSKNVVGNNVNAAGSHSFNRSKNLFLFESFVNIIAYAFTGSLNTKS